MKNIGLHTFLWVCSVIILPVVAAAQDAQFEVASIKPDDPKAPWLATNLDLDSTGYFRYQGGLVIADGCLIDYLIFAYKLADSGEYKVLDAQLPRWAQSQSSHRFHLVARAGDHPTKDDLRSMMRSFLAERFGLKVHTETQQQVAWVLLKTSSGRNRTSQLRPHTGDPICGTVLPQAAQSPKAQVDKNYPSCGLLIRYEEEGLHLRILDSTMPQIAGELSMLGVNREDMEALPGVDGTQMTGKFDLDLHYISRKVPKGAPGEQAPDDGPDFLQALSSQASLQFKKKKVPVEILIVDHVNEPTPD